MVQNAHSNLKTSRDFLWQGCEADPHFNAPPLPLQHRATRWGWPLLSVVCGLLLGACTTLPYPPPAPPQKVVAPPSPVRPATGWTQLDYDGGRIRLDTRTSPCELTLEGHVHAETVRRLLPLLQNAEEGAHCAEKRAVLQVQDGLIGDAITIGAMLRNRRYHTEVATGMRCTTPCLLIFAAGQTRTMPDDRPTELIVTPLPPDQDFDRDACQPEWSRGQQLTITRYLKAMLPPSTATTVYHQMLGASCRHMARYGASEAVAMGLATVIR